MNLDRRIENFEKSNIGLLRDNKVRLLEHLPSWKKLFQNEADLISNKLCIDSLELHHCGSTSIPSIVAKPIIDIVGAVDSLEELDTKKELLEDIGYEYKGEYGIKGRRYSVLYNTDKTKGYCHLHIFLKNSPEFENHILFKDYLIKNKEAANRYENLKKSLNVPRSEYSNAKTEIILELLKEARECLS